MKQIGRDVWLGTPICAGAGELPEPLDDVTYIHSFCSVGPFREHQPGDIMVNIVDDSGENLLAMLAITFPPPQGSPEWLVTLSPESRSLSISRRSITLCDQAGCRGWLEVESHTLPPRRK